MFEPIIDDIQKRYLHLEPFQLNVISDLLTNPAEFKKKYNYPIRHYSQILSDFDEITIGEIFKKLLINPENKIITVFGGYTGQFAKCLKDIGFKIIFTDPIKEFVEIAKKNNFESYCYSVEELPKIIIQRTDLFATFECYMPFTNSNKSIYNLLRLFSAPHGLIFAESRLTRDELKKEGGKIQLKHCFKPFYDNYSIKRIYRENNNIRIYHFFYEQENYQDIITDCRIIKLLYDLGKEETIIDEQFIETLIIKFNISKNQLFKSIDRIMNTHFKLLPKTFQTFLPYNEFYIFSKRFIVEYNYKQKI